MIQVFHYAIELELPSNVEKDYHLDVEVVIIIVLSFLGVIMVVVQVVD